MIDESKINPNLSTIHNHFDRVTARYFDTDGRPKAGYFEEVACYNCGSQEITGEFTVNRFRHVRCRQCGMVYVTPRLAGSILHDMYGEDDFTEVYRLKLIPSVRYRKEVLGEAKYRQVLEFAKPAGRVLDIGCGLGEVLAVFKEHGWDCLGIEFNSFAAAYARETFGLDIVNRSIFDFTPEDRFDVIMLWGVLEHFSQPRKILHSVRSLLSDDGILVLEVPSADSLLVRYAEQNPFPVDRIIEGDRHLMLFSVRGFREMPASCGLFPRAIRSNGLDVSTLNRLVLGGTLDLTVVNGLQEILDRSLQGDLLRGFFAAGDVP